MISEKIVDAELKIKKKKKKRKSRIHYILCIIPLIIGLYLYLAPIPHSSPITSSTSPRLRFQRNVNTTSVVYAPGMYNPRDLKRLLERYLTTKYLVLCMHHLDYKKPYRACAMNAGYFLMNPNITRLYGNEIMVNEESMSCGGTVRKKRYTCAEVAWTDAVGPSNNFTAEFCGDMVVNLQMVIEEFEGSIHCRVS